MIYAKNTKLTEMEISLHMKYVHNNHVCAYHVYVYGVCAKD